MSDEKTPKKAKGFRMKDEHFNKVKSVLHKNGTVKETPASYRSISVGGEKLIIEKGQVLTKEQVEFFDPEAKKHWLTNG